MARRGCGRCRSRSTQCGGFAAKMRALPGTVAAQRHRRSPPRRQPARLPPPARPRQPWLLSMLSQAQWGGAKPANELGLVRHGPAWAGRGRGSRLQGFLDQGQVECCITRLLTASQPNPTRRSNGPHALQQPGSPAGSNIAMYSAAATMCSTPTALPRRASSGSQAGRACSAPAATCGGSRVRECADGPCNAVSCTWQLGGSGGSAGKRTSPPAPWAV